jgi:hypothetical protein
MVSAGPILEAANALYRIPANDNDHSHLTITC